MNIPAPILFVLVVLLGWPLIQIGAIVLSRPFRRRLKDMATDLGADPRLTSRDRAAIANELSFARAGRGESATAAIMAVTPLVLPLIILGDAFRTLLGYPTRNDMRDQTVDRLEMNPQFREFRELSSRIGWMRRPVAAVLAFILSIPTLPVALLAFGVSGFRDELKAVVHRFTRVAVQA